jgi:hypothetical protein
MISRCVARAVARLDHRPRFLTRKLIERAVRAIGRKRTPTARKDLLEKNGAFPPNGTQAFDFVDCALRLALRAPLSERARPNNKLRFGHSDWYLSSSLGWKD